MNISNLLIVDDEPAVLEMLTLLATQMDGFIGAVAQANSLRDARRAVKNCDAAVVDLTLVDSSPENTLSWALGVCRRLPVVLVTGHKDHDFIRMVKGRGMGFVLKSGCTKEWLEVELLGAQGVLDARGTRYALVDEFLEAIRQVDG